MYEDVAKNEEESKVALKMSKFAKFFRDLLNFRNLRSSTRIITFYHFLVALFLFQKTRQVGTLAKHFPT